MRSPYLCRYFGTAFNDAGVFGTRPDEKPTIRSQPVDPAPLKPLINFITFKDPFMKSLSFAFHATPAIAHTSTSTTAVSLHKLVDRLMNSFIPAAVSKNSFIINDVDENFQLHADEQVLAFVVGNLLHNAISSSKSVCIRVEAVKKTDGIHIRVRNNGSYFYSTVSNGFSQVVEAARHLGGSINIYNQRYEGTVVTLSMAA